MDTVQSLFAGKSSGGISSMGHEASHGGGSASSSGGMSKIAGGGSFLSSLSEFALTLQKSADLRNQAIGEDMAAKQEYITAQEKANAINSQFATVAEDQLAVASASGVDLLSGSVTEARAVARGTADREVKITRNSAETNAAARRARALALRQQAKANSVLGVAKFGFDMAKQFATAGAGGA